MKIAIIGTGGVGGYFGARLAAAGNDVRFLARGKHLDAIRNNGLQVKSILGDVHLNDVNVSDRINELGKVDLVLLAIKSWQVKEVAKELGDIVSTGGSILPLQNGVMAASELTGELEDDLVLNGLCRIFSMVEAPGIIFHKGVKPRIVFGERDNQKTERVKSICSLFEKSGIHYKLPDDIEAEVWKKFISICLSGLMAVTKTTYGSLRSIPENRKMMFELLNEVYTLALKIGINLEKDYVEKAVSFIETFNYDANASLTRDVLEGRPSEIEYQNGTVVRLAEKFGVNVPLNKYVYESILPLEKIARNGG